jgi:hypothetical protein
MHRDLNHMRIGLASTSDADLMEAELVLRRVGAGGSIQPLLEELQFLRDAYREGDDRIAQAAIDDEGNNCICGSTLSTTLDQQLERITV